MFPSTRPSPGEDPSPLILLNDCKNESRSGVDANGVRHSPVASVDSTYPDTLGDASEFVSPFPQDMAADTQKAETFGQDTAAKSAAYAGDEIYVENMWGELRKATPPPSGQATLRGNAVRSDHLVNKKLKGFAEMFIRKRTHTTHNIELQERRSRDSLVLDICLNPLL